MAKYREDLSCAYSSARMPSELSNYSAHHSIVINRDFIVQFSSGHAYRTRNETPEVLLRKTNKWKRTLFCVRTDTRSRRVADTWPDMIYYNGASPMAPYKDAFDTT